MLDEYVLFLDESSCNEDRYFIMAGYAVNKKYINDLRLRIDEIRNIIWDEEYLLKENPSLHCVDLTSVYHNRHKHYLNTKHYGVLITKTSNEIKNVYTSVYNKLCSILNNIDITVFGCAIDRQVHNKLYGKRNHEDFIHIAFENIIENYTYFLTDVNGCGDIIYENMESIRRNDIASKDVKLYNDFCRVKMSNKGINNLRSKDIHYRIRKMDFQRKNGDNLCLSFADFVAYNSWKMLYINCDKDKTEFMKKLYKKYYNGGFNIDDTDLRYFYGIKIIPNDVLYQKELKEQINLLIKRNKRLKRELNNKEKIINRFKKENMKKTIDK